jgi:hypothetical protein
MPWENVAKIPAKGYVCGYCGHNVASDLGWCEEAVPAEIISIRICPCCKMPSFFHGGAQIPGVAFGNSVANTPEDIQSLYEEARKCTSAGAYTATVMLCRKLLMHIAVEKGDEEDKSFTDYVNYLANKGFVPPDGRAWVDHIREKGNQANHEIKIMDKTDAEELIVFCEMLLKFIYEFPSKVAKPKA